MDYKFNKRIFNAKKRHFDPIQIREISHVPYFFVGQNCYLVGKIAVLVARIQRCFEEKKRRVSRPHTQSLSPAISGLFFLTSSSPNCNNLLRCANLQKCNAVCILRFITRFALLLRRKLKTSNGIFDTILPLSATICHYLACFWVYILPSIGQH